MESCILRIVKNQHNTKHSKMIENTEQKKKTGSKHARSHLISPVIQTIILQSFFSWPFKKRWRKPALTALVSTANVTQRVFDRLFTEKRGWGVGG